MRSRWIGALVIGLILSLSACSIFDRAFREKKPNFAPAESLRPVPYGPRERPIGYNAAIAWLNVCQKDANNTDGYALVYSLNLIGIRENGSWVPGYSESYSVSQIAGGLFSKSPWFGFMLEGSEILSSYMGAMLVPTGTRPDCVFHPWQSKWFRPELQPEIKSVLASADIQCFGNAVAQVGADYWPEPNSTTAIEPPPEVVEVGASRWISAADGRVTLLLGE